MDNADEREAFLNAIFDAPDDDLPRLVFADWLDERGESDWAELIRCQCQERLAPSHSDVFAFDRGFQSEQTMRITSEMLTDPQSFRLTALRFNPHWYGCTELKIAGGLVQTGMQVKTILTTPVTARIARIDFSGLVKQPARERAYQTMNESHGMDITFDWAAIDAEDRLRVDEYRPVVTVQAVETLVNAREARRLTHLDLRNNDLDNDAARAIVHSTNLIRMKSLQLFDGNQLRGRTWQQLLERFGQEVVQ
jgi:uncharacterized protein (TIGR02996 family)